MAYKALNIGLGRWGSPIQFTMAAFYSCHGIASSDPGQATRLSFPGEMEGQSSAFQSIGFETWNEHISGIKVHSAAYGCFQDMKVIIVPPSPHNSMPLVSPNVLCTFFFRNILGCVSLRNKLCICMVVICADCMTMKYYLFTVKYDIFIYSNLSIYSKLKTIYNYCS